MLTLRFLGLLFLGLRRFLQVALLRCDAFGVLRFPPLVVELAGTTAGTSADIAASRAFLAASRFA